MFCDAHTHLLHGVDNGAAVLSEAVTMCRALTSQRIRAAIVAPHYRPSEPIHRFLIRRDLRLKELRTVISHDARHLYLVPSAEVPLDTQIVKDPDLESLLIPGTRFLPISLPIGYYAPDALRAVVTLIQKRQMHPFFLHMERYLLFYPQKELDQLIGTRNAVWSFTVRCLIDQDLATRILRMLLSGKTVVPSSNAHNLSTRPPEFRPEYIHFDGTPAERVYKRMITSSDQLFKPLLPYWRSRGF